MTSLSTPLSQIDVFLKLQVVPKKLKKGVEAAENRPSSQKKNFRVVIPKITGWKMIHRFLLGAIFGHNNQGQLAVNVSGVNVLCPTEGAGSLSAGLASILGDNGPKGVGGSIGEVNTQLDGFLYVNVCVKENCNTPLERTPNNPPGQL